MVSQKVSDDLTERAAQFGVILDDISITHLTFGKEFTQAVEMKQVAQQEAEKARFLVEKAEQQKQVNTKLALCYLKNDLMKCYLRHLLYRLKVMLKLQNF